MLATIVDADIMDLLDDIVSEINRVQYSTRDTNTLEEYCREFLELKGWRFFNSQRGDTPNGGAPDKW